MHDLKNIYLQWFKSGFKSNDSNQMIQFIYKSNNSAYDR